MDDVIEKMSIHFAHLGLDEAVLQELQQTWEQKVVASRVAPFPEASTQEHGYAYTEDPEDYNGLTSFL